MNKRTLKLALIAALGLQLVIMAGVFINGFYPLWVGEEIRLKTQPVDPRDLFRGNYARLNYPFSNLEAPDFLPGDVIYLPLTREGNLWTAGEPDHHKPEQGLFLRGRVSSSPWWGGSRLTFGIEALFAPKEKALALERQLREEAVAVVRVAPNGRAALVSVNSE
ncbi:GDYXXLXY domain-containing protein [Alcanivorax sp. S6407]|uniref:GDYXXLXY domain-containing protein n=1 Tax=Alcanivorax sp. S6407 TaxID=2926424 RepID=UPI001FF2AB53|nr:GDYXXLXY domain-containing protein [Alcanivorax sp. S6407]MCK0153972.1 GDYXXLXY domain-containing protein [Alcanivorax sp. S6407]